MKTDQRVKGVSDLMFAPILPRELRSKVPAFARRSAKMAVLTWAQKTLDIV
jgi:hypothetical protein